MVADAISLVDPLAVLFAAAVFVVAAPIEVSFTQAKDEYANFFKRVLASRNFVVSLTAVWHFWYLHLCKIPSRWCHALPHVWLL